MTLLVLPLVDVIGGARTGRDLATVFSDDAVLVYTGTLTLSSACLSAISLLVWHRPALQRDADEESARPWRRW